MVVLFLLAASISALLVVWHFHITLPTLLRLQDFLTDGLAAVKFEHDESSGVGK